MVVEGKETAVGRDRGKEGRNRLREGREWVWREGSYGVCVCVCKRYRKIKR